MANSVIQTIKDAEVDARSLSEFIYSPADAMIARRLAPSIHSLQYYLDFLNTIPSIIQNAIDTTVIENSPVSDALVSVDGSLSQRTINKGLESIADLSTIKNPKDGLRVYVKSYHAGLGRGGGYFIYDSLRVSENDGGSVINGWVREGVSDSVLPEFFGAYGDAGHDDTDAVQKTINYAGKMGAPVVITGIYNIYERSSITYFNLGNAICVQISKPVEIIGKGGKIQVQGGKYGIWVNADDVTFKDLEFDTVPNTVRNARGQFIHSKRPHGSVALDRPLSLTNRLQVIGCKFTNSCDAAVGMSENKDAKIIGNYFSEGYDWNGSDIGGGLLEAHNCFSCTFSNNVLKNSPTHGLRINGCKDSIISFNYGENLGRYDWNAFIYIDTGTNDVGAIDSERNLVLGNKCRNVQNGIRCGVGQNRDNKIIANDFECKYTGVYLQASLATTIIQSEGVEGAVENPVTMSSFLDNLVVKGNSIKSDVYGIYIFHTGLTGSIVDKLYARNVQITGNNIAYKDRGIRSTVSSASRVEFRDSVIKDNVFEGTGESVSIIELINSTISGNSHVNGIKNLKITINTGLDTCFIDSPKKVYGFSPYAASDGGFFVGSHFYPADGTPVMLQVDDDVGTLPINLQERTQYYIFEDVGRTNGWRLAVSREDAINRVGIALNDMNNSTGFWVLLN